MPKQEEKCPKCPKCPKCGTRLEACDVKAKQITNLNGFEVDLWITCSNRACDYTAYTFVSVEDFQEE